MPDPTRTHAPNGVTATYPGEDATHTAEFAGGPPTALPSPVGYDLFEEVGRGGMGVVFRARDRSLNREVAVKVLAERYSPDSPTAARFVEEAQITGRLAHPGIPAVHQVGTLPDGRPFLAMKLIRGKTLDVLLKADGPGSTRWLGVFEAVCQAVGSAHSKGVIHRDLKPQNVMVGAFGEVQVMDWGLAKRLGWNRDRQGAGEVDVDPPLPHAPGAPGSDLTQAGSVLGTPAFMAPEQAGGETDRVDERSDVFGLGAVLCTLLTGSPPYSGDTAEAVRRQAARGDTAAAFARLDAGDADPEVVALCKQCLAVAPADRPANAGEVAQVVAAFRRTSEERARQAEVDRAKAEVEAGERRKRRWVLAALAAAVLVGFGLWWRRESDRQERWTETARTAEAALARAEQLRKQSPGGDMAKLSDAEADLSLARQALAAAEQAEAALAAGISDSALIDRTREAKAWAQERVEQTTRRVETAKKEAEFLDKLPAARTSARLSETDLRSDDEVYGGLFRLLDIDILTDHPDRIAERFLPLPQFVHAPAVIALYDWRMNRTLIGNFSHVSPEDEGQLRLLALLDRIDQDPWRMRFRKAVDGRDTTGFDALLREAEETKLPADSYLLLHWALRILGFYPAENEAALAALQSRLLQRGQLLYPDNPFIHEELGDLHAWGGRKPTKGDWFAATACYRAALAVRPESDGLQRKLWNALTEYDPAEGIAWAKRSLANEPKSTVWLNRLGSSLAAGGHVDAALVNFRRAIELEPNLMNYEAAILFLTEAKRHGAAVQIARECHAKFASRMTMLQLVRTLGNSGQAASDEVVRLLRDDFKNEGEPATRYWTLDHLKSVYMLRQEPEQVAMLLREFVAAHPKHWEARRDLAGHLEKTQDAKTVAEAYRAVLATMPDTPESYLELADNVFTDPITLTPYRRLILSEGLKAHPKWLTEVPGYRLKLAAYACEAAASTHRLAPAAEEKLELWKSALRWMIDEYGVQIDAAGKPDRRVEVRRTVGEWLDDPNPVGVRNLTTSDKLPESERKVWAGFWADVRELHDLCAPRREALPSPRLLR